MAKPPTGYVHLPAERNLHNQPENRVVALRRPVFQVQRDIQSRLTKSDLSIWKIYPHRFNDPVEFAGKLRHVLLGGQRATIAQHFLFVLFFFNLSKFEHGGVVVRDGEKALVGWATTKSGDTAPATVIDGSQTSHSLQLAVRTEMRTKVAFAPSWPMTTSGATQALGKTTGYSTISQ